jgi:hypothetical protein
MFITKKLKKSQTDVCWTLEGETSKVKPRWGKDTDKILSLINEEFFSWECYRKAKRE